MGPKAGGQERGPSSRLEIPSLMTVQIEFPQSELVFSEFPVVLNAAIHIFVALHDDDLSFGRKHGERRAEKANRSVAK